MKTNHFPFPIHPRLRIFSCIFVPLLLWNVAAKGSEVEVIADSKSPSGNFSLGTQAIVQEHVESGESDTYDSRLMLLDDQGQPIGNGPIVTRDYMSDQCRLVWAEDEGAVAVEISGRLGAGVHFFAIEGDHLVALPNVNWHRALRELLPPNYEVTRLYGEFEKWEANNICIVKLGVNAIPRENPDLSEGEILEPVFRFRLSLSTNKVTISLIE